MQTRREFLKNTTLVTLCASLISCAKPKQIIQTDPKPNLAEIVNSYEGEILSERNGIIYLRSSEKDEVRLVEGKSPRWVTKEIADFFNLGEDRIFTFELSGSNLQYHNLDTGEQGALPFVRSFPRLSLGDAEKKRIAEDYGGHIRITLPIFDYFSKKFEKYHTSNYYRKGSCPQWIDDGNFLYISDLGNLTVCDLDRNGHWPLSDNLCRGYDVSGGNIVIAETEASRRVRYTNSSRDILIRRSNLYFTDISTLLGGAGTLVTLASRDTPLVEEEDNTKNRQYTAIEILGPKFSPDQKKVAYANSYGGTFTSEGDYIPKKIGVYVFDIENQVGWKIASGLSGGFNIPFQDIIHWLPDSKNIAISHMDNAKSTMSPDGHPMIAPIVGNAPVSELYKVTVVDINNLRGHTFTGSNVSVR